MKAATERKAALHHDSYRSALEAWHHPSTVLTGGRTGRKRAVLSDSAWRFAWVVLDVLTWAFSAALCASVFRLLHINLFIPNPRILLISCASSLFAGWLVGAFDRDTRFRSLRFASEYLIAGAVGSILGPGLVALFGNYGGAFQPSRFFLFVMPAIFVVLSLQIRRRFRPLSGKWSSIHRVIVIGTSEEAAVLARAMHLTDREVQLEQIDTARAVNGGLTAVLGSGSERSQEAGNRDRDTIVIAPSAGGALKSISPFLVSLHSSSVPVFSWPAFWSQRVRMHDCSGDSADWLFEKNFQLSESSTYWHFKRFSDIVMAGVGLVLALPLLLLTALVIRIDSRGPAIFRQERIGLRGTPFTIYKFRTMQRDAEKDGTTTTVDDHRLTKIGRILRKFRIDEIPQLLNVLKGDMSIVGPRPEWSVCVKNYESQLPCYHLRHLVKPGITGWAQVNYPYGENAEDARNKLAFDIHYVSNASLVLDCCIILKTLYVLFGRVGGR